MLNSQEVTSFASIYPFRIRTVSALFVVTMYNYHPRLLAKSNIEKQNFSHRVNDVCNGSPSRILRVLLISFGMTIRPRSSTRRTMPVAFIDIPLLAVNSQWYCLQELGDYAAFDGADMYICDPVNEDFNIYHCAPKILVECHLTRQTGIAFPTHNPGKKIFAFSPVC